MMRGEFRQSGFTLFELIVVVGLVALLAGVASERLRFYQEAAEAAAVESNIAMLKTALHIRSVELISANRWDQLQRLPQQNPFELLEEKPANYGGLWPSSGAAGRWYFDDSAKQLLYRVNRGESFVAADGGKDVRFAVVGRNASGQVVSAAGTAYVSLQAIGTYRWFDKTLR